jgi:hypothetical protein
VTTNGLTVVAETILVDHRGRHQAGANIAVTDRVFEEREVALKFDDDRGMELPRPHIDVRRDRRPPPPHPHPSPWPARLQVATRLSVLAEAPTTAPALRPKVHVLDRVLARLVGPAGLEPATERL